MKELRHVSLFSGAMGLDLGLEKAGFKTAICVENDLEAANTIALNRPTLPVVGDIREVTGQEIRRLGNFGDADIPLVSGGPPCQAFSISGTRKGITDERGQLVFEFIRLISELHPKTFVMENVRGLLSMPLITKAKNDEERAITEQYVAKLGIDPATTELYAKGSLLKFIMKRFLEIGYRVDCFVVNAVNYGAPQLRERLILIGNRFGLTATFPQPQYSNRPEDDLPPFKTLGDVIGDGFVDPCPEVMNFSARKLKYLSMIPEGGNWRSLPEELQKESMGKSWYLKGGRSAYWRKLSMAFPSPTVVTMPNHASTSMCHPTELRAISVGEAAAIQEFPHDWRFSGNATAMFRQVGNAVPIRLGEVAGNVIKDLLNEIELTIEEVPIDIPESRIEHIRPHVRTRTFFKNGQSFSGDVSYYETENEDTNFELVPLIPE